MNGKLRARLWLNLHRHVYIFLYRRGSHCHGQLHARRCWTLIWHRGLPSRMDLITFHYGVFFRRQFSGGHFNPAVTVGRVGGSQSESRRPSDVLYIIAQLIGGAFGRFLYCAPFFRKQPGRSGSSRARPRLAVGISPITGLILEATLTFVLMIAELGTDMDSMAPKIGGFGIGLTVAADILVGGPLTGAAMNPARVFGPALAAGFWDNHWIYWVGPIAGASLASWIYTRFISKTI